jgi:predicted signal transduction protein with EAL and GGDEF domain
LVEDILSIINETGVTRVPGIGDHRVALMADIDTAMPGWALSAIGVRLALDDFGTVLLTELSAASPGDILEIDKSFCGRIHRCRDHPTALLRSIVSLGRRWNADGGRESSTNRQNACCGTPAVASDRVSAYSAR